MQCYWPQINRALYIAFTSTYSWFFADELLCIVQFKKYLNDNNNTVEHLELTLVFEFLKGIDVRNYMCGILPVQSRINITAICVLYFYNFEIRRNISNTCIACLSLGVLLMTVILLLCCF